MGRGKKKPAKKRSDTQKPIESSTDPQQPEGGRLVYYPAYRTVLTTCLGFIVDQGKPVDNNQTAGQNFKGRFNYLTNPTG